MQNEEKQHVSGEELHFVPELCLFLTSFGHNDPMDITNLIHRLSVTSQPAPVPVPMSGSKQPSESPFKETIKTHFMSFFDDSVASIVMSSNLSIKPIPIFEDIRITRGQIRHRKYNGTSTTTIIYTFETGELMLNNRPVPETAVRNYFESLLKWEGLVKSQKAAIFIESKKSGNQIGDR